RDPPAPRRARPARPGRPLAAPPRVLPHLLRVGSGEAPLGRSPVEVAHRHGPLLRDRAPADVDRLVLPPAPPRLPRRHRRRRPRPRPPPPRRRLPRAGPPETPPPPRAGGAPPAPPPRPLLGAHRPPRRPLL